MQEPIFIDFLGGLAPVQAEGTVGGRRFYFRSRHEHWTFSVSERDGLDPVDIQTEASGAENGFFREEQYGAGPFDASYMPEDEAERIIRACAEEYLRERGDFRSVVLPR